jgi:hypothetical protein
MSSDQALGELVPLPPFLEGTVAAMRFHRRAGEWDLQCPTTTSIITATWEALLSAFPWAHARTLMYASAEGKVHWGREETSESSIDWLRRAVASSSEGYGFEASFDLELLWIDRAGGAGRSLFPDSASCFLDAVDSFMSFAVRPNLFTDEILVYTPTGGDGFEEKSFPFQPAAAANRAMVETSLRTWETISGGTIVSWDSELVEGVARYGFDPHAVPL